MAKLVDDKSHPSTASILDLFTVPPTQVSFDQGYWQELQLSNACTNEGPYKFIIQSDPHYLHLNRNYLYLNLRIVKEDGKPLTNTDKVAPINLLGKTFAKQVTVLLNGKQAYDSGDLYAYRTFIETELNFRDEAKSNVLQTSGYEKDTPPIDSTTNTGWLELQKKYSLSQEVELMAPLHCDLFLSDRLIVSNAELTVEIHRNSDDFLLMSMATPVDGQASPKYKIEVLDVKWYIRKLQVMDSIHLGIETVLNRTPAKYPLRRISMTNHFVAVGRRSVAQTPVFNGQLPRRIIVAFVKESAFFGSPQHSPFNFINASVKSIQIEAGGQLFPRVPLKADYGSNKYTRAYIQLLEALGHADENVSNGINMSDFKTHRCFYAFDLTPEESDASHWQLLKEGTVIVHCDFKTAVADQGLEMIVYGEFDNLALIDRTRTIHYDYSL